MYEHGTAHFNLPQTVGTDKRDWLDTNQAFADVDAALYTASETASSTASALSGLSQTVAGIQGDVTDIQQDVSEIDGRVTQQGSAITGLTTRVDDVKADALDMICAVDEGTAQVATVAVTEGKYFRYNDVLYIATANINIGDSIIPNTNCRATNVATELEAITSGGEADDETARAEIGNLTNLQTTTKTDLVSAINEVLSQIGGGAMPLLDFTNPLHSFGTTLTYTCTQECYLFGSMSSGSAPVTVTINGHVVGNIAASTGAPFGPVKLAVGDVVTVSATMPYLHVFKEI